MRRLTVSELNRELDRMLARSFDPIEVEGEVGQITHPASGHCYLVLRHGDDVISGVVWRTTWASQRFRPRVGDRVVARGRLGLYGPRGACQLYVNLLLPAGEGDRAREIAARRARLDAEGLLDPRRKRPLPAHPRVVGVVTSLGGAALQDFLAVSRRRYPSARILVVDSLVQGLDAPGSLARALDRLARDGRAEVVVLTRGGGSREDLMAFQDEGLARRVAAFPVPVLSAIGHQVDITLVDLVADAVAETPSAAVALLFPDGPALVRRVDDATDRLAEALARRLVLLRARTDALRARLRHPARELARQRDRLRDLEDRLGRGLRRLDRDREGVDDRVERLAAALERLVARRRDRLERVEARRAVLDLTGRRRARLESLEGRLMALSPRAVLARGYAIALGPAGAVTDAASLVPGDALELVLERGRVRVRVEAVDAPPEG